LGTTLTEKLKPSADSCTAPASVSVVIPCYRCVATIRRAVDSVVHQTLPPAEIILVDDASGDDTLETLRQISSELGSDRVRVIALEKNVGAGGARNAGWSVATQRYVAFLDADDAWDPRKLETQYEFMELHPEVALSGHGHLQIEEVSEINAPLGVRPGYRILSRAELLLSNRFITPSAMVRRDVPQRFRNSRRYMEDHLLWLEIVFAGGTIARLNAELAFIFKAPFGEGGLSSRTLEMEKGELSNYWRLHADGRLGIPAAAALSLFSILKYLRRILLLKLNASAGQLVSIFPVAYMSITYAITGLLIAFGLAGRSAFAADIAVAQGAALATFHAFSANTRNLILGHSETISAGHILLSRLLLVVPLGLTAYALSVYAANVPAGVAAALVLRRGVEWINEVHLCEKEVEQDYVFASGFLLFQGGIFVAAFLTAFTAPDLAVPALFFWAIIPLAASVPYLLRRAFPPVASFFNTLLEMLPHFGSTAIIGASIYAFRLLIVLLLSKVVAGDLFTAVAIGSFMGTMFANVYGPSLVLHEIRSGRRGFPPLLAWALAGSTIAGIGLFAAGWLQLSAPLLDAKSPFFWRAAGLALLGGVVMVFAQRIRLRLVRTRAGVDIFGPDVLMHILLVALVPVAYAVGGFEATILLYPLNAVLALVFYYSADMERFPNRFGAHASFDVLRTALAVGLFLPLFFKLSGEIYNPPEPVVDSGGVLRNLPIPISVLACYGGIVLLGHFRYASRSLGVIFLLFGLMLLASVVTTSGHLANERGKLLLMLQFVLPAFALVLGNLFERRAGSGEALERGILFVLFTVVPVQLLMTWLQGEVALQHSMPFFAVYQHYQFVPQILVSAYLLAMYKRWPHGERRTPLAVLGVLLAVYVAGTFSMLSGALLFGGIGLLAALMARRDALSALALFVSIVAAAVGYTYMERGTKEFVSKYGPALIGDPPPGANFMSWNGTYENGSLRISGEPVGKTDWIVSYPMTAKAGYAFEVEGVLELGGLTIGLVRKEGGWFQRQNIARPGPFKVMFYPPPGTYLGVVANNLGPTQRETKARLTKIGWDAELADTARPGTGQAVEPALDSARDTPRSPTLAGPAAPPAPASAPTSVADASVSTRSATDPSHLEGSRLPTKRLGLLLPNLFERFQDWKLFGSGIAQDWTTFLFGHPRPLARTIRTSAHNYYLDFIYNFGVIAVMPLLVLIVLTFRSVWRHRDAIYADKELFGLVLVVLFLVLVDNNFKVALRQPYPGIVTFFLWGMLLTRLRKRDADRLDVVRHPTRSADA